MNEQYAPVNRHLSPTTEVSIRLSPALLPCTLKPEAYTYLAGGGLAGLSSLSSMLLASWNSLDSKPESNGVSIRLLGGVGDLMGDSARLLGVGGDLSPGTAKEGARDQSCRGTAAQRVLGAVGGTGGHTKPCGWHTHKKACRRER